MKELLESLIERYTLTGITQQRPDLFFVTVPPENAVDCIRFLKERSGFTHLALLTAVDRIENNLFQLTYMLSNPSSRTDLGVLVEIERATATAESIHELWVQAATYQRELHEMFGISFPGSPGLTDSFLLEGWDQIPPMRRDFDTRAYAEKTFAFQEGRASVDPREYRKLKLSSGSGPHV